MHILRVLSGPVAGLSVPVEAEIVIGRDHADVAIDDPALSRSHAAVRPDGQGVVVEDLGSLNGTFVNEKRMSGPVTLTAGSTFRVGSSEFAVETDEPPEASTPPVAEAAAGPRRGRLPALIAGILLLAALITALALVLTGGDSAKTRPFQATATAAIASQPAPRMTILALLRGKPTGEMSAIIVREVDAFNTPGGPAVNLRLRMLFSQPDGSFRADFLGTVRVTKKGVEVVRGKADVSDGTGTYENISGTFTLAGNNPPRTQTSQFTLRGTLEY
jgi:pSer/pThr/pTyr-binding forkhead associated (FHA) protein